MTCLTYNPQTYLTVHLQRYCLNKLIVFPFALRRHRSSTSQRVLASARMNSAICSSPCSELLCNFSKQLQRLQNCHKHKRLDEDDLFCSRETISRCFRCFLLFSRKTKNKSLQIHLLFISMGLMVRSFPLSRWCNEGEKMLSLSVYMMKHLAVRKTLIFEL